MKKLMQLWKDEEGATAVEYGLMVALIAAAIIITVQNLGKAVNGSFVSVTEAINGAGGAG